MINKRKLNTIIKMIIKEEKHCYFVSPHFDDAALSAGALISFLADKVPVTVINVFTKGDKGPYTLDSKLYLSRCKYKDANRLLSERRKEDKAVFKELGVEVINLDFIEALWRKKEGENEILRLLGKLVPELMHLYPTYKFHMGSDKISHHDASLKIEIKNKLVDLIKTKDSIIFCPVGIGKHVDHFIVRDVCSDTFNSVIYWSDFNYSLLISGGTKFITNKKLILDYFDKELYLKKMLIKGYKSQIYSIFPHGMIHIFPDFYYL